MFAIGVHEMWCHRNVVLRGGLAALVSARGVWAWWMLGRNSHWLPELRWAILALTIFAAVAARRAVERTGPSQAGAGTLASGWSARWPVPRRMRSSRSACRIAVVDPTVGPATAAHDG